MEFLQLNLGLGPELLGSQPRKGRNGTLLIPFNNEGIMLAFPRTSYFKNTFSHEFLELIIWPQQLYLLSITMTGNDFNKIFFIVIKDLMKVIL